MDHQRNVRRIEVDRVSDERILRQVEDTSEWPVLVGPGLFNGQQNRIERVAEHRFPETAHRLD